MTPTPKTTASDPVEKAEPASGATVEGGPAEKNNVDPAIAVVVDAEVAPAETVAVHVDQADGEVTIAVAGGDPITYEVADHVAQVPVDIAARFIAAIAGSYLVDGNPGDDTNEEK